MCREHFRLLEYKTILKTCIRSPFRGNDPKYKLYMYNTCLLFGTSCKSFHVIHHSTPITLVFWTTPCLVQCDHHQVQGNDIIQECIAYPSRSHHQIFQSSFRSPGTFFIVIKKKSFLHDKTRCSSSKTVSCE